MNRNILGDDDLLKEFKRLVKTANSRLDRLEKAGRTGSKAYRSAMQSINRTNVSIPSGGSKGFKKIPVNNGTPFDRKPINDQPNKLRFSARNPKNVKVLRSRMNAVQRFLDDETSTLAGANDLYRSVGGTMRTRYGIDLTPDQMSALFDGALWQKLNEKYGSKTAFAIIANVQETEGDISKAFQNLAEKYTYIDKDGNVNKVGMLTPRERMSIGATIGNYMRKGKINYLFEGD